jgi:hypothetical protein
MLLWRVLQKVFSSVSWWSEAKFSNFENSNLIELELSKKLQDAEIVEDLLFEIDTKNFILDLNHVYENVRIIWHYNKNWNTMKNNCQRECNKKGVQNSHISLIEDTIDANYNTITITQQQEPKKGEEQQTEQNSEDHVEDKEGKKETRKIHPINKYSQGISLAESILIDNKPFFIQIVDGKLVLSPKISLSDIDLVPPEKIEYLSKEYSFQSEEEINQFIELAKNETLDSLFCKIKTILKKYIDIDDDFINILAADIIFTYFQDKLGMTHYLLIVGDNNTGKSNILLVFSFLGYRTILDVAITPANIYNFGSQLEEGQCVILEDEIGEIDDQFEKKKMYQVSYRTGTKVTRMYDNNNNSSSNSNNTKRKSSRQQGFFLFSFKMFASENMPDKRKSKGFLERVIPLKAVPGDPQFDISEVVDGSGDEQFKELCQELIDTRKLLLMYRLLHHNETIPDVKLNIKNRYKQLTKPLIRLFQNTESVNDIVKSLSKYLIEKNQEKIDSMDSAILTFIVNLVSKYGEILYNDQIWQELKIKYPSGEMQDKSYSWYLEGYGSISKTNITKICEIKFGAKPYRDSEKGRGLIFNQKTLNKLVVNYSIIDGIKIIKKEEEEDEQEKKEDEIAKHQKPNDTYDTYDTFTECIEENDQDNSLENSSNSINATTNNEENIQENYDSKLKTDENNFEKTNTYSQEVSYLSYLSYDTTNAKDKEISTELQQLTSSEQPKGLKIQTGLFTNPLISESDLSTGSYKSEVINNIDRVHPNSDRWCCYNCTLRDDKWGMMRHLCKHNKKTKKEKGAI